MRAVVRGAMGKTEWDLRGDEPPIAANGTPWCHSADQPTPRPPFPVRLRTRPRRPFMITGRLGAIRSREARSSRHAEPASRVHHPRGQALVEFALVLPIFLTLFIGIIEFSFVFNATLAVNFASRDAALIAAEAGNASGADCAVLRTVLDRISAPADSRNIVDVRIYRANTVGQAIPVGAPQQNVYAYGGSMTCALPGNPSATIPFHLSGTIGYQDTSRCNTVAGCGSGRPLDHIGVEIRYTYTWRTPLSNLVGLGGSGYVLDKANSMRMEPIL
jgi:hypothetical protein